MIDNLLKDDDTDIRRAAKVISELSEAYELGALSRVEFDELAEDVLDIEKIDTFCNTIERKAKIEKAFTALTTIVSKII